MLLDACVLIDFLKADKAVLQLMVQYVGAFSVIGPVVDEVKEINDDNELIELGLIIMEPALEDAYAAGSQRGPLSFEDRLSLLTAKRHGLLLVTNDRRLRRECEPEGVAVLWGLELLAALHKAGGMPAMEVVGIAQAIRESNPKHITPKIVERFEEVIRHQDCRQR
ncbi:PIN domain-containing protein [Pelodictyon luteolum]|nr:PIN domain-containing protein [Pelodictyon luteolum]